MFHDFVSCVGLLMAQHPKKHANISDIFSIFRLLFHHNTDMIACFSVSVGCFISVVRNFKDNHLFHATQWNSDEPEISESPISFDKSRF